MWKYFGVNNHANLQVIYENSGGQTEENYKEPHNSHCPRSRPEPRTSQIQVTAITLWANLLREPKDLLFMGGGGFHKGLTCFMKSALVGLPYWYEGKCMLTHVQVEMHTKLIKGLKG